MKTRLFTVLCLIVTLTLLLPGGVQPTAAQRPTPPNELQLSATDNGRQIDLDQDHMLVINLEANPSTGYGWEVTEMDEKVLRKSGDYEYTPSSDKLGAPGTLTLRFEGIGKGQTNLKLAYRRPWEKSVEPKKTFSAQVQSKGVYRGPHNTPKVKEAKSAPADDQATILAVPSAYNWCNLNGCTPVRDQGNCGSCWAFSTVGALESNIRIKDGLSKDLAEQYLVSCNSDGWGCDGGDFAHDYHLNKYISGEPGAGAVYESDFPYQAADVPCNPPHTHHEKIASWAYVGSASGVPSTAAIKQAIYDHGPVSAAIYAGPAFQAYPGGVFQTNESGTINHAIVLVGWDDTSPGYWILRNSWGTSWGESGYMRIKYGTSQVGYGANYVVYNGSGPTPTPGPTATPTPTPVPGGEKIVNGGFENGTSPWVEYSSGGYELIDTYRPHTGSYSAYMGDYNSATEYIYQTITIPTNGTLKYYWYMTSSEGTSTAYDYMYTRLYNTSGTLVATLKTHSNKDARGAWYQDSLSLASYAGQTLRVQFRVTTDSSLVTAFFVDDVSVK